MPVKPQERQITLHGTGRATRAPVAQTLQSVPQTCPCTIIRCSYPFARFPSCGNFKLNRTSPVNNKLKQPSDGNGAGETSRTKIYELHGKMEVVISTMKEHTPVPSKVSFVQNKKAFYVYSEQLKNLALSTDQNHRTNVLNSIRLYFFFLRHSLDNFRNLAPIFLVLLLYSHIWGYVVPPPFD